ncbi:hypothetical protein EB077_06935 [bacterium]|nr:hypothetical protein [bacterium]
MTYNCKNLCPLVITSARVLTPLQSKCSTTGELLAMVFALQIVPRHHTQLCLYSDSQAVLDFIKYDRCPDLFKTHVQMLKYMCNQREITFHKVPSAVNIAHTPSRIGALLDPTCHPKLNFAEDIQVVFKRTRC